MFAIFLTSISIASFEGLKSLPTFFLLPILRPCHLLSAAAVLSMNFSSLVVKSVPKPNTILDLLMLPFKTFSFGNVLEKAVSLNSTLSSVSTSSSTSSISSLIRSSEEILSPPGIPISIKLLASVVNSSGTENDK